MHKPLFSAQHLVLSSLSTLLTIPLAQAQNAPDKIEELEPIIVNATRDDYVLEEFAGKATVITEKSLFHHQAQSIADVLRNEPGVNFGGASILGLQSELSDVSIRGISNNRVKILVDGLEVNDSFAFGPFQNHGREYIDLNNVKQVEIIRGSQSSLHGSNAIGGVVSLISREPEDLLQDAQFAGDLSVSYNGQNEGKSANVTLAGKASDQWLGLISYTRRDTEETSNHHGLDVKGPKRSVADPVDFSSDGVNAQLVFRPNIDHRFSLSTSYYNGETKIDELSRYGLIQRYGPRIAITTFDQQTDTEQTRQSLSFKHEFNIDTALTDGGWWRLYAQEQEARQSMRQNRQPSYLPFAQYRTRDSQYNSESYGGELQLDKAITLGSTEHEIIYGLSYEHRKQDMLREGATILANGSVTDDFSEKNAPNTTIEEFGIFAQDRISFANGTFTLIPGARYDHYKLSPHADNLYFNTVGQNFEVSEINEGNLSLRLGALWQISPNNKLFANYSEGFRAPSFSETNLGFTNPQQGYGMIANPDLEPEKSKSIELGLRSDYAWWSHSVSAFYNRYKNFIQSQSLSGVNPTTGLIEYKSINLPSTEIYGLELNAELDISQAFNLTPGFSAQTAIAYAKGKDRDSGEPLPSVDPINGHLTLAYDAPQNEWGLASTLRFAKGKKESDIDTSSLNSGTKASAGYGVLDLTSYYQHSSGLSFSAGAYNVFDKEYITWSQARYLSGNNLEKFTNPGRWFGAQLRYEF